MQVNLFDSLVLVSSAVENVASEVARTWGANIASHILVVSGQEELCLKLRDSGLMTAILREFWLYILLQNTLVLTDSEIRNSGGLVKEG